MGLKEGKESQQECINNKRAGGDVADENLPPKKPRYDRLADCEKPSQDCLPECFKNQKLKKKRQEQTELYDEFQEDFEMAKRKNEYLKKNNCEMAAIIKMMKEEKDKAEKETQDLHEELEQLKQVAASLAS